MTIACIALNTIKIHLSCYPLSTPLYSILPTIVLANILPPSPHALRLPEVPSHHPSSPDPDHSTVPRPHKAPRLLLLTPLPRHTRPLLTHGNRAFYFRLQSLLNNRLPDAVTYNSHGRLCHNSPPGFQWSIDLHEDADCFR